MPSYRRRRRRDVPPVELDVNGALATMAGARGLAPDDLATMSVALEAARRLVVEAAPGFLDFGRRRAEAQEVQALTISLLGRYDTVVVFGAGASAVGARLLGPVPPAGGRRGAFAGRTSSWPTRSTRR